MSLFFVSIGKIFNYILNIASNAVPTSSVELSHRCNNMKLKFYSFVLLYITSISKCKTFIEESLKEKEPSSLLLAVNQIIDEFFSLRYLAVNIINSDQTLYKQSKNVSKVDEFTDELLRKRINSSNVLIRISNSKVKLLPTEDRRRCGVFIIQDFQGFLQIFPMISPENFKFNGFFLVVLVADEIPQIEEMFKIVWSLQIYSFIILYENSSGVVIFKTFMPFSSIHRNDTTPVIINEFKNVKFAKDVKKLYPKKMKNLNDSTIRVATAYDAQPFVIANMLPNGSYHLGGRDIYLVRELAKCLNFKINFTFIGNEGFFFENGSASGPMKELMDGKCEMGVADLWLKANRLKFFDSTAAYIMARLAFIIPPGRELTSFEKLLFPFTMQLWTLISSVFLMGFLVILVVTFQKRQIREFVFGTGVNTPHMNMMIAFVGGTQHKLPKRNFARFLLMMFLIFSLIIRSLYQGSFYKFVHSNKHWREKQSIEEMVDGKFTFYLFDYMFDMFQGTQRIVQR